MTNVIGYIINWIRDMKRTENSINLLEDEISCHDELSTPATELSQAFQNFTKELRKQYEINKGVLVVRQQDTRRLAAVSTWHDGSLRDGLTISLPNKTSLFERVAEDGRVYTEDFCESFSGNFFERKLLLDDDSRSFVVQPLKADGEVIGLLAYSSEKPTAFTMFDEGSADKTTQAFASEVRALLLRS